MIQLWEVSDRVCGKRLQPMIPVLLPPLERHGRVELEAATRAQVLGVSAATIDRLLSDLRVLAGLGRRRPAGFGSSVCRSVLVWTFDHWATRGPAGSRRISWQMAGRLCRSAYAQTMVLTDMATGWTECIALVLREAALVVAALERACAVPVPAGRGGDGHFDNDGLFMNATVVE